MAWYKNSLLKQSLKEFFQCDVKKAIDKKCPNTYWTSHSIHYWFSPSTAITSKMKVNLKTGNKTFSVGTELFCVPQGGARLKPFLCFTFMPAVLVHVHPLPSPSIVVTFGPITRHPAVWLSYHVIFWLV